MDHLIPPILFMTLTTPPRHIINTNAWLKYKQRNNIEVEADWNSNEIFADNFNKAVPRITSTNFTECIQVETTDWILQCYNSSVFLLENESLSKKVISALKQCLFWSRERVFSEINCTGNHVTSAMVFLPSDGAYIGVLYFLWGDFLTEKSWP